MAGLHTLNTHYEISFKELDRLSGILCNGSDGRLQHHSHLSEICSDKILHSDQTKNPVPARQSLPPVTLRRTQSVPIKVTAPFVCLHLRYLCGCITLINQISTEAAMWFLLCACDCVTNALPMRSFFLSVHVAIQTQPSCKCNTNA